MADDFRVGDRVQIHLDSKNWKMDGWFGGTIVRIVPYSDHRSFHWIELDEDAQSLLGMREISVFNPRNIRKI